MSALHDRGSDSPPAARRRTVAIDFSAESVFRHLHADAIVCIDVMMSATSIVSAVAEGRRVFVAATEADARARAAVDRAALVAFSPPDTDLITNCDAGPATALIACFRNVTATAHHLLGHRRVALLGAGCREEFSCEDQMAAAWIAAILTRQGFEPEDRRTAALVQRWAGIEPALAGWGNSAQALRQAGRLQDLEFVLDRFDDLGFACVYRRGEAMAANRSAVEGVPAAAALVEPSPAAAAAYAPAAHGLTL